MRKSKIFVIYLRTITQMIEQIFGVYLNRKSYINPFLYEKGIILKTQFLMQLMSRIKRLFPGNHLLLCHIEKICEIIFSLDLLRGRVLDLATFEVCEQELSGVYETLHQFLKEISSKKLNSTFSREESEALFFSSIQSLENIFQNTVQYIMAEPIVFLLFIRDIKLLYSELIAFEKQAKEIEKNG